LRRRHFRSAESAIERGIASREGSAQNNLRNRRCDVAAGVVFSLRTIELDQHDVLGIVPRK